MTPSTGRDQPASRQAAPQATIGARLREARERLHWSASELAGVVGVPAAQIEGFESGRLPVPRETLRHLCAALRLAERDLLPAPGDAAPLGAAERDL